MTMNVAATEEPVLAETEWLGRCRAGDRAAWRWLYDRLFPHVYRLAIRLGAYDREAADVCQEVFLRVYRGLGSFRGEAQFSTWLFRITMNEVSRLRRAGGLRRTLAALLGREEQAPTPAPRPDEHAEKSEACRELEAVLARMKAKHREIFVLHELEELALGEVAAILGCGGETAKSRLRLARAEFERLRRQRAFVVIAGGVR